MDMGRAAMVLYNSSRQNEKESKGIATTTPSKQRSESTKLKKGGGIQKNSAQNAGASKGVNFQSKRTWQLG